MDRYLLPEIEEIDGIPVTSVRRTILDLASDRREHRKERALDHALFNNLVTLGHLWLLYEESWTRGRRGIGVLRDLLIERMPERGPRDGDCARLFWKIVRDYDLPHPQSQHPVCLSSGVLVHLDFAYPDAMLAIETDGYAYHRDREAFERDRERDAELSLLRWRPLRFSWAKLRFDPDFVAATVLAHLT